MSQEPKPQEDTASNDVNSQETPKSTNSSLPNPSSGEDQDSGQEEKTYLGMSRRTLFLSIGGAVVLFGIGGLTFVSRDPIIRPPGGQDEERLISACIRCEKCYEICPRNVIAPSHIEDGVLNMRTPTFDFSRDYCDWCIEENGGDPLCVKVCPTEALALPEGATPENTLLGLAIIKEDWCLAYKLIGCRFCYDACPYEAMELDENNRPYVLNDKCNGCGACESVCVSLQNASISEGATARAITIHPLESN